jgi:Fe-S-cluster containining protein
MGVRALGKKISRKELIESMATSTINDIVDNSICGKCSKCGECCSPFLPICQEEADIIQKYVVEHNIKPASTMLVMQNTLQCPYYDGKKCLIYEVRPLICKEFYCYKLPSVEVGKKFREKEYIPVNLWEIAKEFEKDRRRINEK